jgi:N6-adenosine-specific RNA methylase IME4
MNMLAQYDVAMSALATALQSTQVEIVLKSRDDLDHVKLHAKRVRDRDLLRDAVKFQMMVERWLGVLLQRAEEAGQLAGKGRPKTGGQKPATLDEIGVDRKLSMRARASAALSDDEFAEVISGMCARMASGKAIIVDPVDAARQGDKKDQRAVRERDLAAKQEALPNKRYGVIYADPEWRFEVYSRDTGMDRAADNHYPTSITDAICARPVSDIAADDCALFLWATVPMLRDALRVLDAWGFAYKSHCIWKKDRIGTGYWFRNQHELLLVGTKGQIPAPAMGTQFPSVLDAPIGKHSEKPDAFYEMIETYFPSLPKIELNARRARDGWDRWGLEAGVAA